MSNKIFNLQVTIHSGECQTAHWEGPITIVAQKNSEVFAKAEDKTRRTVLLENPCARPVINITDVEEVTDIERISEGILKSAREHGSSSQSQDTWSDIRVALQTLLQHIPAEQRADMLTSLETHFPVNV